MPEVPAKPEVSVIIVSWNARDYLMECLESLVTEQSPRAMEIIVVDNASSDGSPDWVQNKYPQVKLIRTGANLGFAKANNIGILQSAGRYLCFINSDAKIMKGCIDMLIHYCDQHSDVGVAGPRMIGRDGKLQRSCRGFPTLWNAWCRALALDVLFPRARLFTTYSLTHWPQENLAPVDVIAGCFWLIKRKALEDVGLLDEDFFMYGEDVDWCKRYWDKGWKIMFVPTAEAIHYGGASSSNAPLRFHVEMHRADLQYWRKHHSALAAGCYFLLFVLHMCLRIAGTAVLLPLSRRNRPTRLHKIERAVACLRCILSGRPPEENHPSVSRA